MNQHKKDFLASIPIFLMVIVLMPLVSFDLLKYLHLIYNDYILKSEGFFPVSFNTKFTDLGTLTIFLLISIKLTISAILLVSIVGLLKYKRWALYLFSIILTSVISIGLLLINIVNLGIEGLIFLPFLLMFLLVPFGTYLYYFENFPFVVFIGLLLLSYLWSQYRKFV